MLCKHGVFYFPNWMNDLYKQYVSLYRYSGYRPQRHSSPCQPALSVIPSACNVRASPNKMSNATTSDNGQNNSKERQHNSRNAMISSFAEVIESTKDLSLLDDKKQRDSNRVVVTTSTSSSSASAASLASVRQITHSPLLQRRNNSPFGSAGSRSDSSRASSTGTDNAANNSSLDQPSPPPPAASATPPPVIPVGYDPQKMVALTSGQLPVPAKCSTQFRKLIHSHSLNQAQQLAAAVQQQQQQQSSSTPASGSNSPRPAVPTNLLPLAAAAAASSRIDQVRLRQFITCLILIFLNFDIARRCCPSDLTPPALFPVRVPFEFAKSEAKAAARDESCGLHHQGWPAGRGVRAAQPVQAQRSRRAGQSHIREHLHYTVV